MIRMSLDLWLLSPSWRIFDTPSYSIYFTLLIVIFMLHRYSTSSYLLFNKPLMFSMISLSSSERTETASIFLGDVFALWIIFLFMWEMRWLLWVRLYVSLSSWTCCLKDLFFGLPRFLGPVYLLWISILFLLFLNLLLYPGSSDS